MAKGKTDSEPAGAPKARLDHYLTVVYDTEIYDGSHTVTVRDSVNGWIDVPMDHVGAGGHTQWTANIESPSDEGPVDVDYKLVLDGEHWMAGPNQSARTAVPPTVVLLDDSTVVWEQ